MNQKKPKEPRNVEQEQEDKQDDKIENKDSVSEFVTKYKCSIYKQNKIQPT